MALIRVEELSKAFRIPVRGKGLAGAVKHLFQPKSISKVALEKVSFAVNSGESVAYLGSNGAGKSTTIKILTGVLTPTSGHVHVNGVKPHEQRMAHAKQIGVVFGQRTHLWWDLPVAESLRLLKSVYDVPDETYTTNIKLFSELLELDTFIDMPVRRLSLGQRMRADIAAALLHNPPILFLDEPTIGLDVAVKDSIRRFISFINTEYGTTIMLTSHDLTDIENLCQRLIILDKGHKVYDGSLTTIKVLFARERRLLMRLRTAIPDASAVPHPDGVTVERENDFTISARFDGASLSAATVIDHFLRHYEIADFELKEPGIEHIIRAVFRGQLELTADAGTAAPPQQATSALIPD